MAEQVDETADGRGMDRRSLIKKAAIGGAAVWVAPTLLSSAAHAQGSSDAGTIIGDGFFGFGTVGLFSDDGGEVRAVFEPVPIGKQAPTDGTVEFQVLGGKTYYLCAYDDVEGVYTCCTDPEVVVAGATVIQTYPCGG